jgi:hypothetical protein
MVWIFLRSLGRKAGGVTDMDTLSGREGLRITVCVQPHGVNRRTRKHLSTVIICIFQFWAMEMMDRLLSHAREIPSVAETYRGAFARRCDNKLQVRSRSTPKRVAHRHDDTIASKFRPRSCCTLDRRQFADREG